MTNNLSNKELKQMQRVATGILILSAMAFIICKGFENSYPVLSFLRAGFEGAMVGGIADWFAVTALFRHPLGIPIPHTALIPKRKDEIGVELGKFIRENFLKPAALHEKWKQLDPLSRIEQWLINPGVFQNWVEPLIETFANWLEQKSNPSAFLANLNSSNWINGEAVKNRIHLLISGNLDSKRQKLLIDSAIDWLDRSLDEHGSSIRTMIVHEFEKAGKPIVARSLDSKFPRLLRSLQAKLYRARYEDDYPLRHKIDEFVQGFIENPQWIDYLEEKIQSLFADSEFKEKFSTELEAIVDEFKRQSVSFLRSNSHPLSEEIDRVIRHVAIEVLKDPLTRKAIESKCEEWLCLIVDQASPKVESFIAEEVKNWDAKETAELIEQQVGKDLQWIRINGSVIGFFAGIIIFSASHLVFVG